jgi:hypothetical protein
MRPLPARQPSRRRRGGPGARKGVRDDVDVLLGMLLADEPEVRSSGDKRLRPARRRVERLWALVECESDLQLFAVEPVDGFQGLPMNVPRVAADVEFVRGPTRVRPPGYLNDPWKVLPGDPMPPFLRMRVTSTALGSSRLLVPTSSSPLPLWGPPMSSAGVRNAIANSANPMGETNW